MSTFRANGPLSGSAGALLNEVDASCEAVNSREPWPQGEFLLWPEVGGQRGATLVVGANSASVVRNLFASKQDNELVLRIVHHLNSKHAVVIDGVSFEEFKAEHPNWTNQACEEDYEHLRSAIESGQVIRLPQTGLTLGQRFLQQALVDGFASTLAQWKARDEIQPLHDEDELLFSKSRGLRVPHDAVIEFDHQSLAASEVANSVWFDDASVVLPDEFVSAKAPATNKISGAKGTLFEPVFLVSVAFLLFFVLPWLAITTVSIPAQNDMILVNEGAEIVLVSSTESWIVSVAIAAGRAFIGLSLFYCVVFLTLFVARLAGVFGDYRSDSKRKQLQSELGEVRLHATITTNAPKLSRHLLPKSSPVRSFPGGLISGTSTWLTLINNEGALHLPPQTTATAARHEALTNLSLWPTTVELHRDQKVGVVVVSGDLVVEHLVDPTLQEEICRLLQVKSNQTLHYRLVNRVLEIALSPPWAEEQGTPIRLDCSWLLSFEEHKQTTG